MSYDDYVLKDMDNLRAAFGGEYEAMRKRVYAEKAQVVGSMLRFVSQPALYPEIMKLDYVRDDYDEVVRATLQNGHSFDINVSMDSPRALVRDVMNELGRALG